MREAVNFLTV